MDESFWEIPKTPMFGVFGLPETAVLSRRAKLGGRLRPSFSQKGFLGLHSAGLGAEPQLPHLLKTEGIHQNALR
ncbi:MAG: hypothetical protein IJY66_07720, partial [Clostridia bacterium]|nr:hypothetical protein [Clostridia bacterium]